MMGIRELRVLKTVGLLTQSLCVIQIMLVHTRKRCNMGRVQEGLRDAYKKYKGGWMHISEVANPVLALTLMAELRISKKD
ncbi:unnamed protein product [Prunus armeniaca]